MKKLSNRKGQQGFTLVEVIVVAIIVAALAGVAIPMYTSYVKSSRDNAAANAAGSIASYMGSCLNQNGEIDGELTYDGKVDPPTLRCEIGSDTTGGATMRLPKGIKIVISDGDSSPGTVTATNPPDDGTPQVYNY